MIRKPTGAGRWYSDEPSVLQGELERLFSVAKKTDVKGVFGGIVPHAEFDRSGQMAASTYTNLKPVKYCIILGFKHKARNEGLHISQHDWQTPLGILKHAHTLSENFDATISEDLFENEHCIELQLPFLQFLNPNIRILPILVGMNPGKKAANQIASMIGNENAILVATTDFTHFGPKFNFEPFGYDEQKITDLDMKVIEYLSSSEKKKLNLQLKKTTVCGKNVLPFCIDILDCLDAKAHLLDYQISKQGEDSVSFASMVFA